MSSARLSLGDWFALLVGAALCLAVSGCNPPPLDCFAPEVLRADGETVEHYREVYKVTRRGARLIVAGNGVNYTYEGATLVECGRVD
jgi:hypothetical protein